MNYFHFFLPVEYFSPMFFKPDAVKRGEILLRLHFYFPNIPILFRSCFNDMLQLQLYALHFFLSKNCLLNIYSAQPRRVFKTGFQWNSDLVKEVKIEVDSTEEITWWVWLRNVEFYICVIHFYFGHCLKMLDYSWSDPRNLSPLLFSLLNVIISQRCNYNL